ncbi:MAG: hypothetical protein WBG10_10790 [Pseudolabrys sp.]
MPRHRVHLSIALACAAAITVAGCKNSAEIFQDQNEGGWFSKPLDLLGKPDWARPNANASVNLGPQGPVSAEDLVSADGLCAQPSAALAQAAAPASAPAETQQPATPAATTADPGLQHLEPGGAPTVAGGIALGMTECQAVQRGGSPNNVAISAGDRGERKVVITYLSGPWPGIYTFSGGRLNVIERAPEQPKPAKAAPKKKKPVKPSPAT